MKPVTLDASSFAHGIDGISSKQYRELYRNLGEPFGLDAESIQLTHATRSAIRVMSNLPALPNTIAEMEQIQRAIAMVPRRNRFKVDVTQVTEKPERNRITLKPKVKKSKRAVYSHGTVKDFVYRRDGGRCFYCHCDVELGKGHYDHVLPASRGGKATYANLVLSCPKCNLSKSASLLENLIDILAEVSRRNREFFG